MITQGSKEGTFSIMLLADTQAAPVAAGLAAGIVLVALLASLFDTASPITQNRFHTTISIDGLNDRYSVGEKIDFTVRAVGYGTPCSYPFVEVIDLDRGGKVIFSTAEEGILLPVCMPNPRNFDERWASSQLGVPSPMTVERIGHYKIVANFGGAEDEEYFIVDSTVKRAIDKTRNLGEVLEFLAYYPNANVTVYFITTCATESCETLIRPPATVEYWHETVNDVTELALLRIGLEHRFGGEPNFVQVSCHIRGSEEANEIHGPSIEQGRITKFLRNDERCPQRVFP